MKTVKVGVIGLGKMGRSHAKQIFQGKISSLNLTAICNQHQSEDPEFTNVPVFQTAEDLIEHGDIDAVIIATPHFSHTSIGCAALKAGHHVLVEKPISVHTKDAEQLIKAHKNPKQVFAAMFNQRTNPQYQKLKEWIDKKELGEIHRVSWVITDWFRTQHYYNSGSWRGTWKGEGGGVIINQCPHQLDLFQWLFGMPVKVRAVCGLGRLHKIEVEDEAHVIFELANGAPATFIASTGEAPGINRLEIACDRGYICLENERFTWKKNEVPTKTWIETHPKSIEPPPYWNIQIPNLGEGGAHREIMQNFADAILRETPLIAPAAEGIHSVELTNAIHYSSFKDKTVSLPQPSEVYADLYQELINVKGQPR